MRRVLLGALLALSACEGSQVAKQDRLCADTPSRCAAGTTCWPTDGAGHFACLPSKDYATAGMECDLVVGKTTCGDGLICVTVAGGPDMGFFVSTCAPYCNPAAPTCATGSTCRGLALFDGVAGSSVYACTADPPPDAAASLDLGASD